MGKRVEGLMITMVVIMGIGVIIYVAMVAVAMAISVRNIVVVFKRFLIGKFARG